jgi:3-methyladenine DNA glycosylase Mpg
MNIYVGKDAVCGIQLTIDRVWRYVMTATDVLTVKASDEYGNVIAQELTADDVDSIDKMVTVRFTANQTAQLMPGRGKIMAYMNDLVVLKSQKILIKGVI